MNCNGCDETTQNEFNCNKDDIFDFKDEQTNIINYYSSPIYFSGCPLAYFLKLQSIMNFIKIKTLTENIDFKDVNFIQAEGIVAFIEDRNVQNRGELEAIRKKNDNK